MFVRTTRPALAAAVAALALTLTACGGGDTAAKSPAPAGEKVRDTPSPSPASGGEMEKDESAMGKVDEDPGTVTYDILPMKVDVSTEAEVQKLVSPEDKGRAKGLVMATAHVRYTHKGGPALTDGSDADDATTIWADGVRGTVFSFAPEDAPGCEDRYDVDDWKPRDSHVFCETYLVPATAKSIEVHWSEGEADGEPYVWKFNAKSA
ncbi:lipoprotein [Streptomyces viridochromogenes DSM 40736]|uniref:Lipoprotein n=1 Tax=Streptomyces viridochromogenes (strain DSM 40736 / JCM 4977 / BCRC 1201 / Tue 494) TaxID=591159 RepID=D9X1S7_STRVT|nr:hypothetical protein [Streptomyces viridochromogenes]EFL29499.1 lipoprotein [Streptomyces viridochromogenes DSM 40736]